MIRLSMERGDGPSNQKYSLEVGLSYPIIWLSISSNNNSRGFHGRNKPNTVLSRSLLINVLPLSLYE